MPGVGARMLHALTDLAADLTAAGVPASVRPAAVHPPGAWVSARTLDPDVTLDGAGRLRVHVHLVVNETDPVAAYTELGRLLDAALTVLDPDEPVDTATALSLPDTPPLPAFRLGVDLDI